MMSSRGPHCGTWRSHEINWIRGIATLPLVARNDNLAKRLLAPMTYSTSVDAFFSALRPYEFIAVEGNGLFARATRDVLQWGTDEKKLKALIAGIPLIQREAFIHAVETDGRSRGKSFAELLQMDVEGDLLGSLSAWGNWNGEDSLESIMREGGKREKLKNWLFFE